MSAKTAKAEINWDIQPLGQMSDQDLADILGITHSTVRFQRCKRNIPCHMKANRVDWDSVGLGSMSDKELSLQLDVAESTVRTKRLQRNIPSHVSTSYLKDRIDWDRQPLGQISDADVAKLVGVSYNIVGSERKKRNIASFRSTFEIEWDSVGIGFVSDSDIAQKLQIPLKKVTNARLQKGLSNPTPKPTIPWDNVPFGKVSDAAIAMNLGVCPQSVSCARRKKGIGRRNLICTTKEGERANYPEALIDIYWHEKNIQHKAQVGIGKYRVDWLLNNNHVVEYAGFSDHRYLGPLYVKKLYQKRDWLLSQGYTVEIIWPSDLANYNLGIQPEFTESHICLVCGKPDRKAIRGYCRQHYKEWLDEQHKNLPLQEKILKIRKPLLKVYNLLVSIGGKGIIDNAHRPSTITNQDRIFTACVKNRTLDILVYFGLIHINRISKTRAEFTVCGT